MLSKQNIPTRGIPHVIVINEPDLYYLIKRSRKPEAKAFKRWITDIVILETRRTGGFFARHRGKVQNDPIL